MRNVARIFGLTFGCALAVLALDSFHLFDSFSQSFTKTSASVSVAATGSGIPTAPTPPLSIETRGGALPQPKQRRGLCGSGFVEVPAEFREVLSRYEDSLKDKPDWISDLYKLKNEVKFYGFTFPSEKISDSDDGDLICDESSAKPEEIKFVSKKVNHLLEEFISAVIFNENEIVKATSKISGVPDNQRSLNKVELCLDIECGTENANVEKKTYDFFNEADLGYARQHSNSSLMTSVRNEIRRVKIADSQERELVDPEINRMIDEAYKIGIINDRK